MGIPHKHAAVIKAWADDTSLSVQCRNFYGWVDTPNPDWNPTLQYRIKPKTLGEIAKEAFSNTPYNVCYPLASWDEVADAVVAAYKEQNNIK